MSAVSSSEATPASSQPAWPEQIYQILREAEVRQVAYVPDAGHSHLITRAQQDPDMRDVVLTTEEEGVALVSGAWLGGQRAVMLMQSSGVGNCVNMFSLLAAGQFPFLTIVTMRGEFAEFNPWQGPMGRATQAAFEAMGVTVMRADHEDEVADVVDAAAASAYQANERVAVLLGQRLIGRKKWSNG